MWFLTNESEKRCESTRSVLERSAGRAEADEIIALGTLLAGLPQSVRNHVNACSECRIFAQDLLEVRAIFQLGAGEKRTSKQVDVEPGPYFMSRVMAAIAEREAEQEKSSQTWAAVPRLAHRLTVLASLSLLVAGSWLYQQPRQSSAVAAISAEQSSEGLVEGSGGVIQDDFLLSTADR